MAPFTPLQVAAIAPLWKASAVRARYRRAVLKRRRDVLVKGLHERAGWLKCLNASGRKSGAICGDGVA